MRLRADLVREGADHPLVQAGFCGGDYNGLLITLEAVNLAIGQLGREAAFRQLNFGGGFVPDYFWLDNSERPTR